MSSSHIPVLNDILFYTETDSYDYLTDNRPIYQLDTNIRSVASAMVGMGYGEHSSVNGGLLTPGRGVELLPNGQIRYPLDATLGYVPILGLVIGASSAGLTKVIWASEVLDLATVGLTDSLPISPAGYFITISSDGTGVLSTSAIANVDMLLLGVVKTGTCVSIGSLSVTSFKGDATPQYNHRNLYGVTRVRNMLLLQETGSTPVQFSKDIIYQGDYGSGINPLNISFTKTSGVIDAGDTTSSFTYTGNYSAWVIKEKYTRYLNASNEEIATAISTASNWSETSYAERVIGKDSSGINATFDNYELQADDAGNEYLSTAAKVTAFKTFNIDVYYSYPKVISSSPSFGKPIAKVTVFNTQGNAQGGEPGDVVICEFTEYSSITGLVSHVDRVVLTGSSATALINNDTIFPTALLNA